MPDLFTTPFAGSLSVNPLHVLVRLLAALLLGGAVAWIYRRADGNAEMGASFPTTLVLLTVLISMVTQVIGDNVARAFSLVGALSIVRFRTVVRDTKDTAYVIFAVVLGMAVGAHNLWVASLGLLIVGGAALLMARRSGARTNADPPLLLTVRLGLGHDLEQVAGSVLDKHLEERKMLCVASAKQGAAIEYDYQARLRAGSSAEDLVKILNRMEGVQGVRLRRQGFEES
jgi:hypothetical protein